MLAFWVNPINEKAAPEESLFRYTTRGNKLNFCILAT